MSILSDTLDPVSGPYTGNAFRQTGQAVEAPPPPSCNCTKKSIDLTRSKCGRCLRPCKDFGPNRTKMFHVKHFGTIARQHTMYKTPPNSTVLARGGAIA
jgi:hypothetical protein